MADYDWYLSQLCLKQLNKLQRLDFWGLIRPREVPLGYSITTPIKQLPFTFPANTT